MVLLYWFISVTNKLSVFLLPFGFCFSGDPRLLFLIGIEILSIPAILDFGNVWRLSLSIFLYDYLSFCQFTPLKKGWALISSTPFTPSLSLESATSFLDKQITT